MILLRTQVRSDAFLFLVVSPSHTYEGYNGEPVDTELRWHGSGALRGVSIEL